MSFSNNKSEKLANYRTLPSTICEGGAVPSIFQDCSDTARHPRTAAEGGPRITLVKGGEEQGCYYRPEKEDFDLVMDRVYTILPSYEYLRNEEYHKQKFFTMIWENFPVPMWQAVILPIFFSVIRQKYPVGEENCKTTGTHPFNFEKAHKNELHHDRPGGGYEKIPADLFKYKEYWEAGKRLMEDVVFYTKNNTITQNIPTTKTSNGDSDPWSVTIENPEKTCSKTMPIKDFVSNRGILSTQEMLIMVSSSKYAIAALDYFRACFSSYVVSAPYCHVFFNTDDAITQAVDDMETDDEGRDECIRTDPNTRKIQFSTILKNETEKIKEAVKNGVTTQLVKYYFILGMIAARNWLDGKNTEEFFTVDFITTSKTLGFEMNDKLIEKANKILSGIPFSERSTRLLANHLGEPLSMILPQKSSLGESDSENERKQRYLFFIYSCGSTLTSEIWAIFALCGSKKAEERYICTKYFTKEKDSACETYGAFLQEAFEDVENIQQIDEMGGTTNDTLKKFPTAHGHNTGFPRIIFLILQYFGNGENIPQNAYSKTLNRIATNLGKMLHSTRSSKVFDQVLNWLDKPCVDNTLSRDALNNMVTYDKMLNYGPSSVHGLVLPWERYLGIKLNLPQIINGVPVFISSLYSIITPGQSLVFKFDYLLQGLNGKNYRLGSINDDIFNYMKSTVIPSAGEQQKWLDSLTPEELKELKKKETETVPLKKKYTTYNKLSPEHKKIFDSRSRLNGDGQTLACLRPEYLPEFMKTLVYLNGGGLKIEETTYSSTTTSLTCFANKEARHVVYPSAQKTVNRKNGGDKRPEGTEYYSGILHTDKQAGLDVSSSISKALISSINTIREGNKEHGFEKDETSCTHMEVIISNCTDEVFEIFPGMPIACLLKTGENSGHVEKTSKEMRAIFQPLRTPITLAPGCIQLEKFVSGTQNVKLYDTEESLYLRPDGFLTLNFNGLNTSYYGHANLMTMKEMQDIETGKRPHYYNDAFKDEGRNKMRDGGFCQTENFLGSGLHPEIAVQECLYPGVFPHTYNSIMANPN